MLIPYDFTLLVSAVPPRHATERSVITRVSGVVDLQEAGGLRRAAVLSRRGGATREIFTDDSGKAYDLVAPFDNALFTDGNGGLPFLRVYREYVVSALSAMSNTARKARFHPWRGPAAASDFQRVDPRETGATAAQLIGLERERARVEEELCRHVLSDGLLMRKAREPFLVLWRKENPEKYVLAVEDDMRLLFDDRNPSFEPVAAFPLDRARSARELAADLSGGGERPRVAWEGSRVVSSDPSALTHDEGTLALRLVAVRMRHAFRAALDGYRSAEDALEGLPLEVIAAYRSLSGAIRENWDDTDAVEEAVTACLDCDATGGRRDFTWDGCGGDSAEEMLAKWHDRAITSADIGPFGSYR